MFIKSGHIFSPNLGIKIPSCGKIGPGKFPQWSLKAHFIFPNHGLAVMVKINFPSFIFTNPAKPFLGKIKCAFRDS